MKRVEFIKQLEHNAEQDIEVVKKKNQDYAGSKDPFKNFKLVEFLGVCSVEEAILVRMCDKIQRVANGLENGGFAVSDEKMSDTLSDLRNYANILQTYVESSNNNQNRDSEDNETRYYE